MIGYLICPKEEKWVTKAKSIVSKLRTFRFFMSLESTESAVILFRNKQANSYFHDGDYLFLSATGTLIFKDLFGLRALESISELIRNGETYSAIYPLFRGPFNLISLDKRNRRLTILTDREGLQSGFYCKRENKTFYSSSLILIAALLDSAVALDSVRDFVSIGATVNGRTIFDGVHQMNSASIFMEDGTSWQCKKLWNIRVEENLFEYPGDEIVIELEKRMTTVLSFLKGYKCNEICTDLSGGTDSRTVLAILLNVRGKVDINVAGPEEHEDVMIHRRIADKLKLNSFWYPDPINTFEVTPEKVDEAVEVADGTRNSIILMPALPFFKMRAEKYRILLGGNGGPLFKDHYWLFEFNRTGKKREPNWQRVAHLSTIDYPWQDSVFMDGNKEGDRLAQIYLNHSRKIQGTNNQKLDFVYFDLKMKAYHAPQFTTCNQFFDIYHPFCDGELVEFSININPAIRKRANLQFSLIYKNNRVLAWVPTNNGCPAVPSMGRFFYLRAYVFLRYWRALWRKLGMYVIKKNVVPSVYRMSPIYNQLKESGYIDKYLDIEQMHTRNLFKKAEFLRMLDKPFSSSNLDYLLNAMSVELALERKEALVKAGEAKVVESIHTNTA